MYLIFPVSYNICHGISQVDWLWSAVGTLLLRLQRSFYFVFCLDDWGILEDASFSATSLFCLEGCFCCCWGCFFRDGERQSRVSFHVSGDLYQDILCTCLEVWHKQNLYNTGWRYLVLFNDLKACRNIFYQVSQKLATKALHHCQLQLFTLPQFSIEVVFPRFP